MLAPQPLRRSLDTGQLESQVVDLAACAVELVASDVEVAVIRAAALITQTDRRDRPLRINDRLEQFATVLFQLEVQSAVAAAIADTIGEVAVLNPARLDYGVELLNALDVGVGLYEALGCDG